QAALKALTWSPEVRTSRILPLPPGLFTTRPLPCGTSASAASLAPPPDVPPPPPVLVDPPPAAGAPLFELELSLQATNAPGASNATTKPQSTSRRERLSVASVVGSTAVTRILPVVVELLSHTPRCT